MNLHSDIGYLFFKLIRLGLGTEVYTDFPILRTKQWRAICDMGMKQSVIGILLSGIEHLPQEKRPEKAIMIKLVNLCLSVEHHNRILNRKAVELSDYYIRNGFSPILLKGQGIATLYPKPEWRMPGDIDLWLTDGRKKVTEFVKKENPEAEVLYLHIKTFPEDGIELEIHTVPSMMYNPFADRKLRKWMNVWKDMAVRKELPGGVGAVYVPCDEMNRVYMLVHKYRHVFSEGIGLRQMTDYMMLLRKGFTEEERLKTVRIMKELNLTAFCRAVMFVLTECLGMEKEFILMEPDRKSGMRLLEMIITGGNFGKYDSSYRDKKERQKTLLGKYITANIKNIGFLRDYPNEALWGPYSMLYNWIWRKLH